MKKNKFFSGDYFLVLEFSVIFILGNKILVIFSDYQKKKKNTFKTIEKMNMKSELSWCVSIILLSSIGLCTARSGLYSEETPSSVRIEQCHEGCIKKVSAIYYSYSPLDSMEFSLNLSLQIQTI